MALLHLVHVKIYSLAVSVFSCCITTCQKPCGCSVAKSCLTLCNSMDYSMPGFPVLHYLLDFDQTHDHWYGDASQPSHPVFPFFSCPQSFRASRSFPMSQLFTSGGQSIRTSASVLPMNIQGWFPLGLTGLISLLSKGLPRVNSSTTFWKHKFFGTQPLWSNSHIHTWLLEKSSKLFYIYFLSP